MHTPITSKLNGSVSLSGSITPQLTSDLSWFDRLKLNKLKRIQQWVEQGWQQVVQAWSNPPELRVWQRRDRSGQVHWYTYDPYTNQSASFGSEADVKAWINDHLVLRRYPN